jgi:hypothetical protein
MGVIIDVNRFHELFSSDIYLKTLASLYNPLGPRICYGGKKYLEEIGEKNLKIIEEFSKINKTYKLNEKTINDKQSELETLFENPDFDDPHILAMCMICGCRLIISNDIRMKTPICHFFSEKKQPKLIRSDQNFDLLFNPLYRMKKQTTRE